MSPYYQDQFATIYLGDANTIIRKVLSPYSIDLIITDPPYQSLDDWFKSFKGKRLALSDPEFWFTTISDESIIKMLQRLKRRYLKESGALYCFSDVKSGLHIFPALKPDNVLVWDKLHIGMGGNWRRMHEWIAYCSNRMHVLRHRTEMGDIIRVAKPCNKIHPTEKPLEVVIPLLINSSDVGNLVFDPFMGSGTTLLAAKTLGRFAIGCDVDEKWCMLAAGRLARGNKENDILAGTEHVKDVAKGFGF